MKTLAIFICMLALGLLLPGALPVQAAEIVPESGTISYTGNSNPIQFTDVNTGLDGKLYITDKFNTEAVVLDPLSGEYKVYILYISPGDAGDVQPAPDSRIWYTDNKDQLGVFDPDNCSNTDGSCPGKVWTFPKLGVNFDLPNIGPLAFDSQGRVWVGDFGGTIARLYRVNQTSTTNLYYCPYDIGNYHTHDMKYRGDMLWFGDYANHRMLRFDPVNETLSAWPLSDAADPAGLAFDASGGLWWAETLSQRIGHLVFSASDTLTYYTIPGGAQPLSVAVQSGMVWYTDKNGTIGWLDPAAVNPTSSNEVSALALGKVNATCSTITPPGTTPDIGGAYWETSTLQFNAFNPPLVPDTSHPGWTIYTLASGAKPAGMAAVENAVYAADSDTSTLNAGKLVRFTSQQDQYQVYLPLILR